MIILYGYIILGVVAYLVTLLRYLLPDDKFRSYTRQEQRIFKLRRYVLLPIPFVALWPIIAVFRILLHIEDRRAETKRAIKKMKQFICSSKNKKFRYHGYDSEGRFIWPFDTLEDRIDE